MTIRTNATLKGYFNTGDIPVEAQFADLIDTSMQGYEGFLIAASDAPQVWIDHADYTCDGTNDEVQIQAAIDALPAAGGIIRLSPGTFTCAKVGVMGIDPRQGYSILIDQNDGAVKIEGSGWATVVKLADNIDANTCLILLRGEVATERNNPTVIESLKIDGNKTGQAAAWTDYSTLEITYANDILIQDCYFTDPNWCCTRAFRSSERITWFGNYVDCSNGKIGIRTEGKYYLVSNNYIKISTVAGSGAGLDMSVNADVDITSEFITVLNNVFDGGVIAVSFAGGRRCSFFGNRFVNLTNLSGIALRLQMYDAATDYACMDNLIIGNVFYNIRQGIQINGGSVAQPTVRNIIEGNAIIEGTDVNLATGIFETTNADYNIIRNNIINGATTSITKIGANTIVAGNIIGTAAFGTFTANDATPAVVGYDVFKTANTNPTTITMLDNGYPGQRVTVIINDANTTVDFSGTNLKGNAGADWSPASGDYMNCTFDGTNWYCAVGDTTV